MSRYYTEDIPKSSRISRLIEHLYAKMPEIEADRAVLLTESYQQTEGEPMITRRAKAFVHILEHIPITIRPEELIVGSATKAPGAARYSRSFLLNGWNRSLIPLNTAPQTRFISLKIRKKRFMRCIGIGRERRPANWLLPIWLPRHCWLLNIICSLLEIIFITASAM